MNTLQMVCDCILHLDQYLTVFIAQYGFWIYGLLFLIIFCETALIVFPFLPGDSLLFTAGTLAAHSESHFNIHLLFVLLTLASIMGNGVNYFLGHLFGQKLFANNTSRLFNRNYLAKAHVFFEQYGGKAIILARFIPIVRTFVPFVAGMGYMIYRRFFYFNAIGAFLWIGGLLYISYLFGNIPVVKEHFSVVIISIILLSLVPPVIEFFRRRAI